MASSLSQTGAFQLNHQNANLIVPSARSGNDNKIHHQKLPHYVYTPEQQQDFDNKEKEEEDVSGEVLDSLLEKLDKSSEKKKKDNNAMAFLRKKGKVGGNKDFTNAIGSDEGSGMSSPKTTASNAAAAPLLSKSNKAYQDAIASGIIDDLSEAFPMTSSGGEWRGTSDRIRGGTSEGSIQRETVSDKTCNVLVGHVSKEPNAFLQMITDLSNSENTADGVDASMYDGIELDMLSQEGLQFNVHLRSAKSPAKKNTSYCHTATLECLFGWSTIRIPFTSFVDPEDGSSVDYGSLSRLGIVALEPESEVNLAVSGVRFYSVF